MSVLYLASPREVRLKCYRVIHQELGTDFGEQVERLVAGQDALRGGAGLRAGGVLSILLQHQDVAHQAVHYLLTRRHQGLGGLTDHFCYIILVLARLEHLWPDNGDDSMLRIHTTSKAYYTPSSRGHMLC